MFIIICPVIFLQHSDCFKLPLEHEAWSKFFWKQPSETNSLVAASLSRVLQAQQGLITGCLMAPPDGPENYFWVLKKIFLQNVDTTPIWKIVVIPQPLNNPWGPHKERAAKDKLISSRDFNLELQSTPWNSVSCQDCKWFETFTALKKRSPLKWMKNKV